MRLPSYKEILKMGKEKIAEKFERIKNRIKNRTNQQVLLEMARLNGKIATKKALLHEEQCKEKLNFKRIVGLQNSIMLLERKWEQHSKIVDKMIDEMFPDI